MTPRKFPYTPRRRPFWPEARRARLRAMVQGRWTPAQAADELGCTRNAILGAAWRMGLRFTPCRHQANRRAIASLDRDFRQLAGEGAR